MSRSHWGFVLVALGLSACSDGPVDVSTRDGAPKAQFNHTYADASAVWFNANAQHVQLRGAEVVAGDWQGIRTLFHGGIAYAASDAAVYYVDTRGNAPSFVPSGLAPFIDGGSGYTRASGVSLEFPEAAPAGRVPLGITPALEVFAFDGALDQDYLIFKYTLTNASPQDITGLHAGYMMDMDFYAEWASQNLGWLSGNAMFTGTAGAAPGEAAVQLLSGSAQHYGEWMNGPPVTDPTTLAGWFGLMSHGLTDPVLPLADVRQYLGQDGITIPAGGSVVLAYAFAAGADHGSTMAALAQATTRWASDVPRAPLVARRVPVTVVPGTSLFTATIDLGSAVSKFDAAAARCARAPVTLLGVSGTQVQVSFRLQDMAPELDTGEPLVCAARLTDGTYAAGYDMPVIPRPYVPVVRLTSNSWTENTPSYSPDGGSIAFVSQRPPNPPQLVVLDRVTGVERVIPTSVPPRFAAFAPDGSILFSSASAPRIYRVTTTPPYVTTQLTPGPATDTDPHAGAGGTRIVFQRATTSVQLYAMPFTGAMSDPGLAQPVTTIGTMNGYPEYAPDGSIYFTSTRDGTQGVYRIDPSAGEPAVRVSPLEGTSDSSPAISPDGRWLAYATAGMSGVLVKSPLVLQDLVAGTHQSVPLPPGLAPSALLNLQFSPDGMRILLLLNSEIYEVDISALLDPGTLVQSLAASVQTLVAEGQLRPQDAGPLLAKLRSIGEKIERGSMQAACNELGAFINQLQALVASRRLSQAAAAPLLDAARQLIARLQPA